MELSNSAKEMVVQAQMLLLDTGGQKLCVEHLFYGVLLLADYLEPPMDKPEFRKDGEKVRAWLETWGMQSVAAARQQLKMDAEEGGGMFEDAAPVLGRAAEIADGGEIGAMELTRAVAETSTPTVMALRGLRNRQLADKDARYAQKDNKKQGKKGKKGKQSSKKPAAPEPASVKPAQEAARQEAARKAELEAKRKAEQEEAARQEAARKAELEAKRKAEQEEAARQEAMRRKEELEARKKAEQEEAARRKAAEEAAKQRAAQEQREKAAGGAGGNAAHAGDQSGLTPSQVGALLAFLAIANSQQTDELRRNAGQGGRGKQQGGPKVVRRTKMGPFTYRGGTVAAVFQYFLFGILVPGALLSVFFFIHNKVTGGAPVRMKPFPSFLLYAFISVWFFYLARGVSLVFGIFSSALGNFLDILLDLGLLALLVMAIQAAWHMPVVPVWLRVAACLIGWLILTAGIVLFNHLRDEGDVTKTRVNFQNKEGTPGKIFFQSLAEACRLPFLVFAIHWIRPVTLPAVVVHILWIAGYFWVWNNVFNMYACLCIRCTSGRHKGLAFFQFLHAAHLFFTIPEFVVFLHWHFQWFPMKHWVMIVLGIYSVLAVFLSFMYARIK